MATVLAVGATADTPVGSGSPKPSSTDSPSSSTASSAAAKVNACSVSPLSKVTMVGAPE